MWSHGVSYFAECDEESYRHMEYDLLIQGDLSLPALEIRKVDTNRLSWKVAEHFEHVVQVEKLEETRALLGFARVKPQYTDARKLRRLLWGKENAKWLPAVRVHGEGIFMNFSRAKIDQRTALCGERDAWCPYLHCIRRCGRNDGRACEYGRAGAI